MKLPSIIKPVQLAKQSARLAGNWPLSGLTGLQDLLASNQGEITLGLQFRLDEEKRALIEGELSGELVLICQRCGKEMVYKLNKQFELKAIKKIEKKNRN